MILNQVHLKIYKLHGQFRNTLNFIKQEDNFIIIIAVFAIACCYGMKCVNN